METFDEPPKTGTTIVACVYDGGVVLGADTRVSTGIYVSNRASDKMTVLADSTVMCRSGSAADTEAVAKIVRYHVEQIGMERDSPLDVKTVAQISNQINYQNKSVNNGAGFGRLHDHRRLGLEHRLASVQLHCGWQHDFDEVDHGRFRVDVHLGLHG